jgi:hypothetical protein
VVDGHQLGEFLGRIMDHTYVLPLEQMQKALVYTGVCARARVAAASLVGCVDV